MSQLGFGMMLITQHLTIRYLLHLLVNQCASLLIIVGLYIKFSLLVNQCYIITLIVVITLVVGLYLIDGNGK